MIRTDGSASFPFSRVGFSVLFNCSLCGIEAILFYLAGLVCLSFYAESCAILQIGLTYGEHQLLCHFSSFLLLSSCFIPTTHSFPPSFGLAVCHFWHNHLFLSFSIRLQWVPSHSSLLGSDTADVLVRRGALLQLFAVPCNFSPLPL